MGFFQITRTMGLIRLGCVVLLSTAGVLAAPSALPDKSQSAAPGYGAPAQPSCTLQVGKQYLSTQKNISKIQKYL